MTKVKSAPGALFGQSVLSAVELLFKDGIIVTAVKVKYPGIDPLIIVSAKTTDGLKVAFVGGSDLDQAGAALHKLVLTGSVDWRPDKWANE